MNYFNRIILSFIFILTIQKLNAQSIEWFVQGNFGQSKANFVDSEWKSDLSTQWAYTGGFRYKLSNAISLESGISFISIKNDRTLRKALESSGIENEPYTIPGEPYGVIQGIPYERTDIDNRDSPAPEYTLIFRVSQTSRYLGIPISILIKRKRLGFRSGVQTMFLLDSYETENSFSALTTFTGASLPTSPLNKIDLGLLMGLHFKATKNLGIDINYYHGLRNVHRSETEYSSLFTVTDKAFNKNNYRNQSLSVGISYSFSSPE